LILNENFQAGANLSVKLLTTALSHPLQVQIVHIAEVAPGWYLLGGAFTGENLEPAELEVLLN